MLKCKIKIGPMERLLDSTVNNPWKHNGFPLLHSRAHQPNQPRTHGARLDRKGYKVEWKMGAAVAEIPPVKQHLDFTTLAKPRLALLSSCSAFHLSLSLPPQPSTSAFLTLHLPSPPHPPTLPSVPAGHRQSIKTKQDSFIDIIFIRTIKTICHLVLGTWCLTPVKYLILVRYLVHGTWYLLSNWYLDISHT